MRNPIEWGLYGLYCLFGLGIAVFIGYVIWTSGLPDERIKFYNNGTLVCRDWNDEWSIFFTKHECYPVQK
jgi:hypothetical protein